MKIMKMKVKIKDQYKGNIRHNGVSYNLEGYSDEKLQLVWESNPDLRFMFEEWKEVEGVEIPAILPVETPEDFNKLVKEVSKKKKGK